MKSIRFVTCKQEPNVSLMADAYGRLTGKPGVCVVTAGPGRRQLHGRRRAGLRRGLADGAHRRRGAAQGGLEAFHGVDDPAFVHEMFKKITKWSARVERIEDIPEVMAKAFHIARSGRPGPGARRAAARVGLQRIHPPGGAAPCCRPTSRSPTVVAAARPGGRRPLREAAHGGARRRSSPRARASSARARCRSSRSSR